MFRTERINNNRQGNKTKNNRRIIRGCKKANKIPMPDIQNATNEPIELNGNVIPKSTRIQIPNSPHTILPPPNKKGCLTILSLGTILQRQS
jgi:hypothetical protein